MATREASKINLKQAGFSLVELMVVVAIIGILAAMSVGGVTKQIAKARQSEAKTNLSAIYTAEKTFQAEFAAYTSQFTPLAIAFEGTMRYDAGFLANFAPPAAPTYTGNLSPAVFSANTYCDGTRCTVVPTNGVAPGALTGASCTATTFVAAAAAFIFDATTTDIWTINQDKALTNTSPGIP